MTADEQEVLYASLKKHHPDWTNQFCSGYLSGVMDEEVRPRPNPVYSRRRVDLDHYTMGYLTGFALHRGQDCEMETWFGFVSLLVKGLRDAPTD